MNEDQQLIDALETFEGYIISIVHLAMASRLSSDVAQERGYVAKWRTRVAEVIKRQVSE
jgi:hypothetical protein